MLFILSILIHFVVVYQIQISKTVDEIYVLDLTTYQEFKPKKVETIKPVKKVIEKPIKKKLLKRKLLKKK